MDVAHLTAFNDGSAKDAFALESAFFKHSLGSNVSAVRMSLDAPQAVPVE